MKFKNFLLLLIFTIFFTACVERIERTVHHASIAPEYTIEKERLKGRIMGIIPAKEVNFSTSTTEATGEPKHNTLHVEILNPKEYPSNLFTFLSLAGDVRETAEESIGNIETFDKMEVVVRTIITENGIEQNRFYKRKMDL